MDQANRINAQPMGLQAEVQARRELLPQKARSELSRETWGLALSGGGIRSATFCFGLLRSLARKQLLHRFDILSTVSGGGYIGATLGKLFQNELSSGTPADPIKVEAELANADSRAFMAWLRANGRYLIPRGAHDVMFAAASYARNLLGVHLELAFVSLLLGGLIVGFDLSAWSFADSVFTGTGHLPFVRDGSAVLSAVSGWPTLWLLMPIIVWICAVLSCAFWALPSGDTKRIDRRGLITFCGAALVLIVMLPEITEAVDFLPKLTRSLQPPSWVVLVVAAISSAWCVGVVMAAVLNRRTPAQGDAVPHLLTAYLARVLTIGVAVLLLGVIDYLAWFVGNSNPMSHGKFGAFIILLAVALRAALPKVVDLPTGRTSLTRRVVLNVMNAAGLGLLALVCLFWMSLIHRATSGVMFPSTGSQLQFSQAFLWWSWIMVLVAIPVLASASNREFLNRSSLFGFYRARLVRSYLGAVNEQRPRSSGVESDVTSVHPRDDVEMRQYFPHRAGGPIHLVNVCVNQTSDPRGGLFNQDRKGLPLVVGPGGKVSVDRGAWSQPAAHASLTLGSWMAISGAAVAPGLGASTCPGVSAILMMAGIRLGYWWDRSKGDHNSAGQLPRIGKYGQFLSELRGRFEGTARRDWFLSDGGHFENTAAYALLQAQCGLIVMADCGADPQYLFGDLENLVRKARIDLRAEITFLRPKAAECRPPVAFGSLNEIASPESQACLAVARVDYAGASQPGYIIVVKPNMCQGMPVDLVNFKAENPLFPQEPTTDQMFSEAQWESYFKLGSMLADNIDLENIGDMRAFATKYFVDDDGAIVVQDPAGKQSLQVSLKRLSARVSTTGAVSASISIGAITSVALAAWQAVSTEIAASSRATGLDPAVITALADTFGKMPSSKAGPDADGRLGEMASALLGFAETGCNQRNKDAFRHSNMMRLMIDGTKRSCRDTQSNHVACKALLNDDKVSDCLQLEPRPACVPMYWARDYSAMTLNEMNCSLGDRVASQRPTHAEQPAATAAPPNNAQPIPPNRSAESIGAAAEPKILGGAAVAPEIGAANPTGTAQPSRVCAGRTVYIQIYGPDLRDAVRLLRQPWRELGAAVPPVEDVIDTARRSGRGRPQTFSVPTVIYHDEASSLCAKSLEPSQAAPRWAVRPLPRNLAGQPGVIEVWLPAGSNFGQTRIE